MDGLKEEFYRVFDEYERVFGEGFPNAITCRPWEEEIAMMKQCIADGKPYEYDESLIY